MALEDALAKLRQAADDVEAEVRALAAEVATPPPVDPTPVIPTGSDSSSGGDTPSGTDAPVSEASGSTPTDGSNVAQQDIVPPAPTTEPPSDTDEATEATEEPASGAAQ